MDIFEDLSTEPIEVAVSSVENQASILLDCLTKYRFTSELDAHGEQMVEPVFNRQEAEKIKTKLLEVIEKM